VIRDTRHLAVRELGAFHTQVDVRSTAMRVTFAEGHNVASDFALLQRAAPFVACLAPRPRAELLLVLRGQGRYAEGARRGFLSEGDAALSCVLGGASLAYAGEVSRVLCIQWEPDAGVPLPSNLTMVRFGTRDAALLSEAAASLGAAGWQSAISRMFRLLRAIGFTFAMEAVRELEAPEERRDASVRMAWNGRLSRLDSQPSIEEVARAGGTTMRQVNRTMGTMARRYALPWSHWKGTLHGVRMLQALRLLSCRGATTEVVARATGFRSPSALCHALAIGGLPSPGVLAREACRDVLERWSVFGDARLEG
jgi:hypothetical protein